MFSPTVGLIWLSVWCAGREAGSGRFLFVCRALGFLTSTPGLMSTGLVHYKGPDGLVGFCICSMVGGIDEHELHIRLLLLRGSATPHLLEAAFLAACQVVHRASISPVAAKDGQLLGTVDGRGRRGARGSTARGGASEPRGMRWRRLTPCSRRSRKGNSIAGRDAALTRDNRLIARALAGVNLCLRGA